ncbi:hypothetical protein AMS68_006870 [Peltaster fructicola]|uniref:Deoxyribonuclease NucA/NucB domain-containing protein n=1 Tax=Peltaster fructicola TaxID=286661 RepID=A0A6H0Y2W2_9PEZI|nr:hypothetical protein AMS68_006870 [Peltaster fructicola]
MKLILLALASQALAAPGVIFNCADNLQDVCANMCWGAYCTRPSFGVTLNYDRYGGTGNRNSPTGVARQKSAGCAPRPNRCSTKGGNKKAGQNCDEYPFASTSDADKGGQVSKCVIIGHNSRQGNILKQYYQGTCGGKDCQFIITFGNPAGAGVRYCQAYNDPHGQCINDMPEQIYKNGKPDVRPASKKREEDDYHQSNRVLMASGMEVLVPMGTPLNTTLMQPVARNATMKAWVEDNDEDEDLIEWDFEEDHIVAILD